MAALMVTGTAADTGTIAATPEVLPVRLGAARISGPAALSP